MYSKPEFICSIVDLPLVLGSLILLVVKIRETVSSGLRGIGGTVARGFCVSGGGIVRIPRMVRWCGGWNMLTATLVRRLLSGEGEFRAFQEGSQLAKRK